MGDSEFIRRCADLYERCCETSLATCTKFLTPAQRLEAERAAKEFRWENFFFWGGEETERRVLFFLPFYMTAEDVDFSEYISAVRAETKFSSPGHRDYLGSIMGLGVKREYIGDIIIQGETGYFYCLPSVEGHILQSLEKIGRSGVKAEKCRLCDVPRPETETEEIRFTVKSPRLDAVAAGMFGVSRSSMAELIVRGEVFLNYEPCLKCDAEVSCGDILSVRGRGKGKIGEQTGKSRKDRLFITAEIYK